MKTIKVVIIIALVIIILPLLGYAGWLLKKDQPLEIFVVNKSMTQYKGSENKALNYLLNSEKVFTAGGRTYDLKVDHFGLQWNDGEYRIKYPRLKEVGRTAKKYDLFYYADACGIRTSHLRELSNDEEDDYEYGGVNNTDYNLIKEGLHHQKPIIIECGFYGPPTDPLVRYNLEQMIDIYYAGWMGKYVGDLSGEADLLPGYDWKKVYSVFTGEPWTATGPGIVMINMEARRIFVLEEELHIQTNDGLIFTTEQAANDYGIAQTVNYKGWFTLLHPGRNAVLSEFRLNPTEAGKALLNEFGVPSTFPALISRPENLYYMAGDFGKSAANGIFPKVMVIGGLLDGIKHKSSRAENFFYSYYQPFMTSLVEEALAKRQIAE